MRIIAGVHKGIPLTSAEGMSTRPTTDYIREMIFSTLYSMRPPKKKVLDLFAGSGALGLEALSRGASSATFVETENEPISKIHKNIEKLNEQKRCTVIPKKADFFLKNCKDKFDLIFADPPYERSYVNVTLYQIYENELLSEKGIIIIEHSINEPIDPIYKENIIKEKINGKSVVTFLSW